MKRVLVAAWIPFVLGCPLQTSTSSTMPSGGGSSSGGGGGGGNVTVPDVVGKTKSEAEAAVASAGLRGGIRIGNDAGTYDEATGKICSQTPGGGNQSASSLFVSVRMCDTQQQRPTGGEEPIIVGLSVDDAKKKIAAHGFDGKVEVMEQYEFDKDCKAGTVCGFEPRRWYINQDRSMRLFINRKVTISAPE